MDEEKKTPQTENNGSQPKLKFSLWFYITLAVCAIIFVIISAVTAKVCYWAAALAFAVLFAEFLRLFLKSKHVFLIIVAAVSAAAFALTFSLWIMALCGMG